MQALTGTCLKDALLSGSNHLTNHQQEINSLNIFPVPDGDTGTNMAMTCQSAVHALEGVTSDSVSVVATAAASAMLRGAKGNSGVILSLLWKGFAQAVGDRETLTGPAIVDALDAGVKMAYGAVMKPTEGTILTVARMAQEAGKAALSVNDGVLHVWEGVCKGAKEALAQTPELLHVLKRANVVDAGGKGLCLLLEGMLSVLGENAIVPLREPDQVAESKPSHIGDDAFRAAAAAYDDSSNFTYCTECIIGRKPGGEASEPFRQYLTTIGDCVVVVDDVDIVKAHVHTDNPGAVLEKALALGALLTVKVDNMAEQAKALTKAPAVPVVPTEDFGFVAVAAGEGLSALFQDLGCKQVIRGGQTMNPSTEEIVNAILQTPAKTVFVLPNNKNILMAAEQAVSLVEDRDVVIVPTKTAPQGISALLAFSSTRTPASNQAIMLDAARHVATGQVTHAARDSKFGTTKIKTGDRLGLIDGRLTLVEKEGDPVHTAVRLTRSMLRKDTRFVTIFYGEAITEDQAAEACEKIKAKADKNVEINVINGGQPVYDFLLSVE